MTAQREHLDQIDFSDLAEATALSVPRGRGDKLFMVFDPAELGCSHESRDKRDSCGDFEKPHRKFAFSGRL